MTNVTINLEISDQHCADILCTAFEGGIGYWAQARNIKRHALPEDAAHGIDSYLSMELAELNDDETGYDWSKPLLLDYDAIRRGVVAILAHRDYARMGAGIVRDIVSDEMGCYIDAGVADCIVQMGVLGEVRYG
jgi:hypothetical protein